jgi:hypothetical protein
VCPGRSSPDVRPVSRGPLLLAPFGRSQERRCPVCPGRSAPDVRPVSRGPLPGDCRCGAHVLLSDSITGRDLETGLARGATHAPKRSHSSQRCSNSTREVASQSTIPTSSCVKNSISAPRGAKTANSRSPCGDTAGRKYAHSDATHDRIRGPRGTGRRSGDERSEHIGHVVPYWRRNPHGFSSGSIR